MAAERVYPSLFRNLLFRSSAYRRTSQMGKPRVAASHVHKYTTPLMESRTWATRRQVQIFWCISSFGYCFVRYRNLAFPGELMNSIANVLCQFNSETLSISLRGQAERASNCPTQSLRLNLFTRSSLLQKSIRRICQLADVDQLIGLTAVAVAKQRFNRNGFHIECIPSSNFLLILLQ